MTAVPILLKVVVVIDGVVVCARVTYRYFEPPLNFENCAPYSVVKCFARALSPALSLNGNHLPYVPFRERT